MRAQVGVTGMVGESYSQGCYFGRRMMRANLA